MPKIVKYGLILFAITAATGLILGGVYTMTLEPIRLVQEQEKNEALASTLPGATEFKAVEIKDGNPMITEIYEGSANGEIKGYNFTVTPKGYAGLITTVVGVNNEGRVMDIKILSHSETPGLGAKAVEPAFAGQFKEKLAERGIGGSGDQDPARVRRPDTGHFRRDHHVVRGNQRSEHRA